MVVEKLYLLLLIGVWISQMGLAIFIKLCCNDIHYAPIQTISCLYAEALAKSSGNSNQYLHIKETSLFRIQCPFRYFHDL